MYGVKAKSYHNALFLFCDVMYRNSDCDVIKKLRLHDCDVIKKLRLHDCVVIISI